MIIDNQTDGLTCDITGNFLDIYLDENNNSFSNIDNLPTPSNAILNQTTSISTMNDLPKSILSFKNNLMQCLNCKFEVDENNDNLLNSIELKNSKLNQQQLTKQSVKRALFVEKDKIDHEANLKLVRNQMEQLEKQDCEKWNFDFKNNCPLNTLNIRYEWFKTTSINEPVLSRLDLNQKDDLKASPNTNVKTGFKSNDKKTESNAILQTVSSSSHCEFNSRTGTRSIKRKLIINDYFQPTKKHASNLLKDQAPTKSTDLLPINKNKKFNQNEITIVNETTKPTSIKSIKLQQIKHVQPIHQSLKRKCKKMRTTPQKQRVKQKKSLQKVTKRQTTLKF